MTREAEGWIKGERRGRGKARNMNRGFMCVDNAGDSLWERGGDGAGKSNEKKGRTIVTEQQYLKKKRKLHQEITSCI